MRGEKVIPLLGCTAPAEEICRQSSGSTDLTMRLRNVMMVVKMIGNKYTKGMKE